MNIFLPYEHDIEKSVQSLDDLRLNKQILECDQLALNALKERSGVQIKGYKNHPIYVHYKNNIPFLIVYGYLCCVEYQYRFNKKHALTGAFMYSMFSMRIDEEHLSYTPFYMEGSIGQPNYIRTLENVSELYQKKLCDKWDSDKAKGRQPKWTNREIPEFYKGEEYNG
jgi:hypothetical protein